MVGKGGKCNKKGGNDNSRVLYSILKFTPRVNYG